MKGIAAAFLVLAGMAIATAPVPAFSKSYNEVSGGSGDASATDECPPGHYLVGVRLRTGAWWDQMQIACAEFLPEGKFGPVQYPRPPRGGNGGGEPTLYRCDERELITGAIVVLTEGRQVVQAILQCMSTTTGATRRVSAPWSDRNASTTRKQLCSSGEVGVGFGIRYGKHVNALGLICDTFHAPAPAAPTPPPVAEAPAERTGQVLTSTGRTTGSATSDRTPAPNEVLVCRGGGMTETPLNEGRSVYIHFVPAAGAAEPAPGECAWTNRLFGQEGRRLALQLSTANAQLVRDAARGGGTFTLEARPIGTSFIMVASVLTVQVEDGTPLSPGPIDATVPAQAEEPPPPAPGGGQQQTASICALPGGTATVLIADPALTMLNVRDKPAGTVINQIAEGSQVTVMGGCGVQLSAGIVAQQGGGQAPVPGWCAISTATVTGCVAEEFLVAGIPAANQAGLPPGAGIVAAERIAANLARIKQDANIRDAASREKSTVLTTLPGGSMVEVIECGKSWCRLAMPQYPVAWVSRSLLAFDVAAAPAAAPSIDVTINIGGAAAPAPATAPQPATVPDGGQTASTCGLPGGTATVVIPDPNVTTLNVRDKPMGNILTQIAEGSQVTVMGGCGVKIAAGIVAQQGGGQAPVPGWCAISGPATGCVAEQFLVAGAVAPVQAGGTVPAAGIAAMQSPSAAAPTFTGTWKASAQGSDYSFELNQNGNAVTGSYTGGDGSKGQIDGKVSGNVLRFGWRQTDGLTGAGRFALSADGNAFTGSYTLGTDPDVAEGSWNGIRR